MYDDHDGDSHDDDQDGDVDGGAGDDDGNDDDDQDGGDDGEKTCSANKVLLYSMGGYRKCSECGALGGSEKCKSDDEEDADVEVVAHLVW